MKRVKVDFSTTVKGGLIKANQKRASEPLQAGDEVEAYDPAEEMEFVGVVDHLTGQFAFLRMKWEDNTPVPSNRPGQNLVVASWSALPVTQPLHETSAEGLSVSLSQASPPLVAAAHPMSA